MRRPARGLVRSLRCRERAGGALLRRLREPPRRDAAARREVPAAGVGIERRLVSVLFADLVGLHGTRRAARRRGRARAPVALLRAADTRRALRRQDREVHRRRGHGGLGHADGSRGRRRARGPRGARARRRGRRARHGDRRCPRSRRARRSSPARPRSRSERGVRAWWRAISSTLPPGPVGRAARHGPRWRRDPAGDGSGHRLCRCGTARAEGKGGAGAVLAGTTRHGRAGWWPRVEHARSAVRRPGPELHL